MTRKIISKFSSIGQNRHLRRIGTILKILFSTVLIIFLLLEVTVLGIRLFGGEAAIAKLPVYILQVTSDSMFPTLKTGDCVLSANVEFECLQTGDLITYYFNGSLVTHEIVALNDNGTVTTKGSMNSYVDGEISEEYYVGKVIFRLPYLNYILSYIETPMQKVSMIALIFIILFGYQAGMALLGHGDKKD